MLLCCCQNTRRRRFGSASNTSKRRRSARVMDHDSEPCMLILDFLVIMLMRCLRKSGHLISDTWQNYISSLGSVMSREEEPAFVIRDPRYVKESTNCNSLLYIFNGRLLVGLGVTAFDQLICFPTRLASSCSRPYCQSFLDHRCRRGKDRYLDE